MTNWEQYGQAYSKGSTLYRRGREAMDAGDLDAAIPFLEESARTDPHFKTLELIGECFLRRQQHRQAVIPLAASVGLGTKPYRALYLLAQALDGLGSRREAIEKLKQALEIKPDYKSAHDLLEALRALTGTC